MYQIILSINLEDCKITTTVKDDNENGKSGVVKVKVSSSDEIGENVDGIANQWQKVIMNDTPQTGKNHTCTARLFVDGIEVASDGPKIIRLCP